MYEHQSGHNISAVLHRGHGGLVVVVVFLEYQRLEQVAVLYLWNVLVLKYLVTSCDDGVLLPPYVSMLSVKVLVYTSTTCISSLCVINVSRNLLL